MDGQNKIRTMSQMLVATSATFLTCKISEKSEIFLQSQGTNGVGDAAKKMGAFLKFFVKIAPNFGSEILFCKKFRLKNRKVGY